MMISIVTPSYNQSNFISSTINSIVNQEFKDFELIITDGGSLDGTIEIIKENEASICWWVSEKDRGQSHAINKGINRTSGEILNWINSDDLLEPGALKTISDVFEDQSVNVYCGRSNIIDEQGNILRQSRGTDIYPDNLAKTLGRARIDQPETWWRKSIIDEIGPLNEALHYTMDRDWWVKYLLKYGLSGIRKDDAILANFRLHGGSKTVSQNEAFNKERNAYFRSLAISYQLNEHAKTISDLIAAPLLEMRNLPENIDLELLNDSYANYFLLLADESYVKGNSDLVRKFLQAIDKEVLVPEDKEFANKLEFRSRLPKTLINLVRKLR